MTHTLHRTGDQESLTADFVVFTMSAKTVNAAGSAAKMQKFIEIVERFEPVNWGDMKTGNIYNTTRENLMANVRDTSIVHSVFTDREKVGQVLAALKEAGLGTSVIVSGLVEETDHQCGLCDLEMHTVEFSGGIHGRTELLPEDEVLAVTTMCGHGMVARNLVRHLAGKVRRGKMTLAEAGIELAKPCQCGIFNPIRAERLIEAYLER